MLGYRWARDQRGLLFMTQLGSMRLLLTFDASGRLETRVWAVGGKADFVVDGRTTKREVVMALGLPSGQFEGERILTYRLTPDRKAVGREIGWDEAPYSLVLMFDDGHVLVRHRLVEVR